MRAKIKKCRLGRRTELGIRDIASRCNPMLQGWVVTWALRKYKSLRGRKTNAIAFLSRLAKENPGLFAHWSKSRAGAFA